MSTTPITQICRSLWHAQIRWPVARPVSEGFASQGIAATYNRIFADDFGRAPFTQEVAQVRRGPADDRPIVRGRLADRSARPIVSASSSARTPSARRRVPEGIETDEQLRLVRDLRVDFA
jgi:EAL domain-containing protein (putative c-di-GMP-specific phosphodiesterase class I)